jgi:hypothetical protein
MSNKINYDDFLKLLRNVDVPDEELAKYVVPLTPDNGAFNIRIAPDINRVEMTDDEKEFENAMSSANSLARWRRSVRFKRNFKNPAFKDWPVLVSEGDSWFQFPLLIEDVIDHLGNNYLINCLGAAGDTAANMATGPVAAGGQEYFSALKQQVKTGRLQGFVFSAAGNDVIGEEPVTKSRTLAKHLLSGGAINDPQSYVDHPQLTNTLATLKQHYESVIQKIRRDHELSALPIFIHGYDYCFPGGHPDDPRKRQLYAKRDQWLGSAFQEKGITIGRDAQRNIIKVFIDRLYDMMHELAVTDGNVHVVDVRNSLPNIADWNDEIHGTSAGFKTVAMKFDNCIARVV